MGIYHHVMNQGSNNFSASAIQGIVERIKAKGIEVVVHEAALADENFHCSRVIRDMEELKRISDVIVANRLFTSLADIRDNLYARDLFGNG